MVRRRCLIQVSPIKNNSMNFAAQVYRAGHLVQTANLTEVALYLHPRERLTFEYHVSLSLDDMAYADGLFELGADLRRLVGIGEGTSLVSSAACFLFYLFLDTKNCDAITGDLEERYGLNLKKFGKGKANLWYWTQALRSVGPIAWEWAKKCAVKPFLALLAWAAGKGLLGEHSWVGALVEMWKRIRS